MANQSANEARFFQNRERGQRSSTPDREPLLTIVATIVARHRLPFGSVYEALNLFAGVAHAREMTRAEVTLATDFGKRVLAGTTTPEDFETIERNRGRLGHATRQLVLVGF
ncbi:hypothetical protein [Burkholderia aenigmatica]|uniref:hypothetical protein n=1 Tax=Burkholderia aenigmatica TaxID=2015348 RepID=UPI002650598E|nr:hypothetical protein [Burkholderia aenigmatica]MDN7878201.1 hypothetical protein [Burkholderia aenigmatica]